MDMVVLTTSHAKNITSGGLWQIPTSTSQRSRYLHNNVYHSLDRYSPNKCASHNIAENNKKNNRPVAFRERSFNIWGIIFSATKVYLKDQKDTKVTNLMLQFSTGNVCKNIINNCLFFMSKQEILSFLFLAKSKFRGKYNL
jgi:hypothetical protein